MNGLSLKAGKSAVHVAVALVAYLAAYALVLEPTAMWWFEPASGRIWLLAGLYALLAAGYEAIFRTERSAWRLVSAQDGVRLLRSTFLTAVTFLLIVFLTIRASDVPRSVLLIAWILHLGGLMGLRLLRRMVHEGSLVATVAPMFGRRATKGPRLLLVGDIGAADAFLRELSRNADPEYEPVAILGVSRADVGRMVRDVAVIGTLEDLESTVEAHEAGDRTLSAVLFLSPPDVIKDIAPKALGRLKTAKVTLLRLPAISELSAAHATLPSALRELSVEELLARPAVKLDLERIRELIDGKRVFVTGAGGSIGSEICRQVTAFGCVHLSMLDHSEFSLFKIDQEVATAHPTLSRRELICDVRDAARVQACIAAEKPDIIFHAAALKHVPIVENHPAEGMLTNVVGTWNVSEAARACGVAQMVMISTDKAVEPSNVMGATKRLAEAVIRGQHGRSRTVFSVVRFGNVLGSAGSVVPTFQAQIERGGPVTVTHPDVERYFMTIPEAVQLVLHATAESAVRDLSAPSVFVLEMGKPVKIVELARGMIALHGLTVDKDIAIAFTGLRPGEKLSEDLIDSNERVQSQMDSVIEVVDRDKTAVMSAAQVKELEKIARAGDDAMVRDLVYRHVARLRGEHAGKAAS